MLDLNELAVHTAELIVNRGYLERRHNSAEDDGLLGLLTLATVICKHNPPFKSSPTGQVNADLVLLSCPLQVSSHIVSCFHIISWVTGKKHLTCKKPVSQRLSSLKEKNKWKTFCHSWACYHTTS